MCSRCPLILGTEQQTNTKALVLHVGIQRVTQPRPDCPFIMKAKLSQGTIDPFGRIPISHGMA